MGVNIGRNEAFDRAIEVSAETVEKDGFENRAFKQDVCLSGGRIQRLWIRSDLVGVRFGFFGRDRGMRVRLSWYRCQRLWQRWSLGEKLSKRVHVGLLSRNRGFV